MAKQIKKSYQSAISQLFTQFDQKEIGYVEFIDRLECVQFVTGKSFWFKFSDDDTLATTVNDLKTDLKYEGLKNYNFTIDRIHQSVKNNSLAINFS